MMVDLTTAWSTPMEHYDLLEIIGEGSYGKVVKAKCKVTKKFVAIKFISNVCKSEYDCVKVIREI